MWGNNKAWRSQARIPEPGQPSCLHRTAPGERWRDARGETEARSGAGLTRLLGNAHREFRALPVLFPRTAEGAQLFFRAQNWAASTGPPLPSPGQHLQSQGHPAPLGTAVRVRHLPPAGCFPRRLCPPPKISCPLPGHPPRPGSSASTRVRPDPPRQQRGKGMEQPPPSLTPPLEQCSPAVTPVPLAGQESALG